MSLGQKTWRWLRVAFGVSLLALLVARVDPREYRAFFAQGDMAELGLGLGLLLVAFPVLQALRLHPLVRRYTGSLAATFQVFMVGAFFNILLPSNVGGDAVRLLYLRKMRADNWGGPFAMLMLHRASGMGVLLLAAAVHAIVEHRRLAQVFASVRLAAPPGALVTTLLLLIVAGASAGLLWLLRASHPWARRVRGFGADCLRATREIGAGAMALLLALTALFHFVRMLAFYVLVRYVGQSVALADLLLVLAATAVAGVLPLTVGGLGLMEGAISLTLGLFGVSEAAGVAVALANRVVLLVSAALGGILYVLSGGPRASTPQIGEGSSPSPARDART